MEESLLSLLRFMDEHLRARSLEYRIQFLKDAVELFNSRHKTEYEPHNEVMKYLETHS